MQALANTKPETAQGEEGQQVGKRLAQLELANSQKEGLIAVLEKEVHELEGDNQALRKELQKYQQEWKELQAKEEQKSEEDEQQMHEWIETVQKYNGLPQEAIDSLLTIQFQGGQHEICPACFQELAQGVMCTYLPCAHLFHRECIANHLKVNKFCLACQEAVVV